MGADHLYGISKDSSSSNLVDSLYLCTDLHLTNLLPSPSPSPPPSHHHPFTLPIPSLSPFLLPLPSLPSPFPSPSPPPFLHHLPPPSGQTKASSSQPEEKEAYLEPENVCTARGVGRLQMPHASLLGMKVNEWLLPTVSGGVCGQCFSVLCCIQRLHVGDPGQYYS